MKRNCSFFQDNYDDDYEKDGGHAAEEAGKERE